MAETVDNPLAKRGPGRPKTKVESKTEVKAAPVKVEVTGEAEINDNDEVKLTGKELKALKDMLRQERPANQEGIVSALVEALRESRKPYKSEADKENERRQREQMKKTVIRTLKNKEYEQAYCQHMAGTNKLSDVPHQANAFTAIVWHDITNQLRWGICTICQREFWPTDSDYRYWRSKRSFNRNSSAGERDGVDTQTWMSEQHPEPFGSRTGIDPREVIQREHALKF